MKKLYIILTITVFVSCGKFLEPKSSSEFIPKNINSLNEMLTRTAYYDTYGSLNTYFAYLEIFNDDIQMTSEEAYFSDMYISQELPHKKLIAMTGDVFENPEGIGRNMSPWQCFYSSILSCNAAIDYLPSVDGSESEKAYVKAQALFLRALGYFYLVNYYGEPYNYNKKAFGVPLKLTSNLSDKIAPRNTVEEVYNQILADLLEAERCWELVIDKQFKENFRASLPATQFLLAKVYLFMENWSEVIKYTDKVLAWNNFTLFNLNTFVASKPITRVNYSTYDNSETIWTYGSLGDFTFMLTKSFNMRKVNPADAEESYRDRGVFIASSSLLNSYGEDNDSYDLRRKWYIFNEYVKDGSTAGEFLNVNSPLGKVAHNNELKPLISAYNPALKFRLSEVYLMEAEAYAMSKTNDNKALSAINTIRENRIARDKYTPIVGLTGDVLINFIREERRRELCFEGSRWFDMRRWGMKSFKREWRKYGQVMDTYIIEENDPSFTFPIPRDVINRDKISDLNKLSSRVVNS